MERAYSVTLVYGKPNAAGAQITTAVTFVVSNSQHNAVQAALKASPHPRRDLNTAEAVLIPAQICPMNA